MQGTALFVYVLLSIVIILWSYLRVNLKKDVIPQLRQIHSFISYVNVAKWFLIILSLVITFIVFGLWYVFLVPPILLLARQQIGYYFFIKASNILSERLKKDPKLNLHGVKLSNDEIRTMAELQVRQRMRSA